MSQAPLLIGLHVAGLCVALGLGIRDTRVACAVGFPLGLVLAVLITLGFLNAGLPFAAAPLAATLGGIAAIGLAAAACRRRLDRATLRITGLWSATFAAVACAASAVNLSILSYDSHAMVLFGGVIGLDGALGDGLLFRLSQWGVFLPVVHSWASLVGVEYMWAMAPVLGLSAAPLFALVLSKCGVRRRLVALVTAALFTVFFFHHHFVYIHNNVPSAIYFFGFVGLMLIAEVDGDRGAALAAFVLLAGAAVMRVEAPLTTLVLASVIAIPSTAPRRAVAAGFAIYAAVVSAWYLQLATAAPGAGSFLTPLRCYLVVAMLAGGYALWWASRFGRLARLAPRAPEIAAATIALGLAIAFALKPAHMGVSAKSWVINLAVSDYWGLAWYIIAAVLVVIQWLPSGPAARRVGFAALSLVGVILLLVFGRHPYRAIHVGDSANRMMLHVLPLVFLYVGLRLGAYQPRRGE